MVAHTSPLRLQMQCTDHISDDDLYYCSAGPWSKLKVTFGLRCRWGISVSQTHLAVVDVVIWSGLELNIHYNKVRIGTVKCCGFPTQNVSQLGPLHLTGIEHNNTMCLQAWYGGIQKGLVVGTDELSVFALFLVTRHQELVEAQPWTNR